MTSPHNRREIERSRTAVDHAVNHPNLTPAGRSWSNDQTLHVAVAISNPCRWRTRLHLFNDFRRHITALPNIRLYVGELQTGDRAFEATCADNPDDFQWRTREILWHKENILDQVIRRFDPGWEYGAWIDADFTFSRVDVGLETIHQLQIYDWVQMFSTYTNLSADHKPMSIQKSVAYRFANGELTDEQIRNYNKAPPYSYGQGLESKKKPGIGTTGGAWAFRRQSYEAVGGLLTTCILGSSDWHSSYALMGEPDSHPNVAEMTKCGERYAESIRIWQNRAAKAVRKNVGFVDCHAIHHFHGSKRLRGYGERWKILRDHDFDPYRDLYPDANGIWQLQPDRVALRDAIRRYFSSRTEDDPTLKPGDKIIDDV